MPTKFETMQDYVAAQPPDVQQLLHRVRELALAAVPEGVEAISYQIPTIKRAGVNVIHFAAWKRHLAVYPIPDGDDAFCAAVAPYVAHKGTLQFKYVDPIPYELIAEVFGRLADA